MNFSSGVWLLFWVWFNLLIAVILWVIAELDPQFWEELQRRGEISMCWFFMSMLLLAAILFRRG